MINKQNIITTFLNRAILEVRTSNLIIYVNADIESNKTDENGIYELDDDSLSSEYTGFNGKVATVIGPVRLSSGSPHNPFPAGLFEGV